MNANNKIPPVVKTVDVNCNPAEAFQIFTEEFGSWWPVQTHSVGRENAQSCALECEVGGSITETGSDGETHTWGTVLTWEPPAKLVFSWHPGREASSAQEVHVTFGPSATGTLVTLEHCQWEKFPEDATEIRQKYERGWEQVFSNCYAQACNEESAA